MLPIFSTVLSWQSTHPGPFDGGLGHLICLGQWSMSIEQFARCTLRPQETSWAFASTSCILVIHHENIPWKTFSTRIKRHMEQYWDELLTAGGKGQPSPAKPHLTHKFRIEKYIFIINHWAFMKFWKQTFDSLPSFFNVSQTILLNFKQKCLKLSF